MSSHYRRSIRLKDYDYTQAGVYFVTICAYEKLCLFGSIVNRTMILNQWGEILVDEWIKTAIVRPNIDLDVFIVMPNHFHSIIIINDDGVTNPLVSENKSQQTGLQKGSLGAILGQYKSAVTKRIYQLSDGMKRPIWQRNYYEHIVRSNESLEKIGAYIELNPETWESDRFFSG